MWYHVRRLKTTHTYARRAPRWTRCFLALLLCVVVGCTATPAPPTTPVASATTQGTAQQGWFAVDQIVRSSKVEGIDLHLRAAERTADGVVVHLSFYNNRGEDLQAVRGINLAQTRLVGARTYAPSARSASLENGIAPPRRWISGGGNVGTFRFADADGTAFELRVPGFPPVRFTLDRPGPSPAPAALPTGTYDYGLETTSPQLQIALRVEQATVRDDGVALDIAFVNRTGSDITFESPLTGNDAVLLDHQWQQYQPLAVDPALAQRLAPPGEVWPDDAENRGMITFARPPNGDVLFFAMPGFAPIRLPLAAGARAAVATAGDLPPSTTPRFDPATPTPRSGLAGAQDAAAATLGQLTDALQQRDRAAYVAAFAPELQAAQGDVFDAIGALPLQNIEWSADAGTNATLSADGTLLNNVGVTVRYHIEDVEEENEFVSTLAAQMVQQNGRWVIAALDGEQPFWLLGPATAGRSGAFWIFYRPSANPDLNMIEREADAALAQVNRSLPERAPAANVMFVAATDDEFAALTGRSGARFVGVASARFAVRADRIDVTNRAFYLNGAAFADPTQDRQRTITHELTHLVLANTTMPYTPAWLSEGAALVVSSDVPTDTLRRWQQTQGYDAINLDALSSQTSFGGEAGATEDQTAVEYAYSAFLATYLI